MVGNTPKLVQTIKEIHRLEGGGHALEEEVVEEEKGEKQRRKEKGEKKQEENVKNDVVKPEDN